LSMAKVSVKPDLASSGKGLGEHIVQEVRAMKAGLRGRVHAPCCTPSNRPLRAVELQRRRPWPTYTFVTRWSSQSPVEPVWRLLAEAEEWPMWWRGVEKVELLESGTRKAWSLALLGRPSMKKKQIKKLELAKETLHRLDQSFVSGGLLVSPIPTATCPITPASIPCPTEAQPECTYTNRLHCTE